MEASNNVVIIDHSTISGDVDGVTLVASTDRSCVLVDNIDTIVSDMLNDLTKQVFKADTDLFGDFSVHVNNNVPQHQVGIFIIIGWSLLLTLCLVCM